MALPGASMLRSVMNARSAARAAARDYTGLGDSLKSLAQSALSPMNASIGLIVVTNRLAAAGRAAQQAQVDLGRQLGVTSQAVAGLTTQFRQASMTVQQAAAPLRTFNTLLGRAAGGGFEANQALQRAGVTLERFRTMSAAEQMRQLGRHLREIRDPADRMRVAFELFGDQAEQALLVLDRIPDVNADLQASFRRTTMTARDAGLLQRQQAAGAEFGTAASEARQGFGQEMAAVWAPALTMLSDLGARAMEVIQPILNGVAMVVRLSFAPINAVISFVQGIGEMVAPIWEAALDVVKEIDAITRELFGAGEGGLMEFAKALGRGFGMLKPAIDLIVGALKMATAAVRAAGNFLGGVQNFASGVSFGLIPRAGGGQAENAAQTAAMVAQQQETERAVREQTQALNLQVRALGQGNTALELFRLELQGATQDQLRRFREATSRLAGEQAVQNQVERFRDMTVQARERQMELLRREGVDQPTVLRAERLRFGNAVVQRALNPQEFRSVSTMTAGSSAAQEAINRNLFGPQNLSAEERLRQALAEQTEIERHQRDYLRQLVEAAQLLGVGDVGPA